jgi:hypothetical protein
MQIKIIGKNSTNRIRLIKNLYKAIEKINYNFDIEILDDNKTIKQYQDISMPILMINNKIISNDEVLSENEIKKFINVLL